MEKVATGKMVRRCTGCNRVVPARKEKCCNAFYDSHPNGLDEPGVSRKTGKPKMPKKNRLRLQRYVKLVEATAQFERQQAEV